MRPEPNWPIPATQPPDTLTHYWCDGCGNIKGYNPFKHYAWGKLCKGTIHTVTYTRTAAQAQPLYRIVYFIVVNVKTALDPQTVKHVFLTGLRHDQLALATRICAELECQFNVTHARTELQTAVTA